MTVPHFQRRETLFLASILGILLLAGLVFSPSLNNAFTNWDDPEYLWENNLVQELSPDHIKRMFTSHLTGKYHPLTLLSFALEYKFFGWTPRIYHLNNLLLHLANILLVFIFLRLLFCEKMMILLPTALFAIHPLHVEAVCWATGRKDVLFTFFYLLSLIAYILYSQQGRCRLCTYLVSLTCFLLSLFAKATAVTLPFLLILLDYFFQRKWQKRTSLGKTPFLALALLFGAITWTVVEKTDAFPVTGLFPVSDRFFLSAYAVLLYIRKLILPDVVSSFYPLPVQVNGWFSPAVYLSPLLVAVIMIILWKGRRKNRQAVFASLFFFILILPVLHLAKINDSIIYDRFAYLSSIGIFLILAQICQRLIASESKMTPHVRIGRLLKVLLPIYILYLSFFSWNHCHIWQNSFTLWTNVIQKFPKSALAYYNRAHYFEEMHKDNLALMDAQTAVILAPHYADSYFKRGQIYAHRESHDLALSDYSKAIELNPREAISYIERGNIYFLRKQYDLAIKDLTRAIQLEPHNSMAYNNRGNIYLLLGQISLAMDDYLKGLDIAPDSESAHLNRAMGYFLLKDYTHALEDLNTVLKLNPHNETARLKKSEIEGFFVRP